ncbi:MAG: type II/IV secretion system protein [Kiritimatiellae bacterium]|nr:type II/IV secretion system protein [Kiritimatiellia bacterium]
MLSANELLAHAETLTDGVQLVDRILRAGLFLHASDIHFDPMQDAVRVRFRIDGQLEEVLRVPVSMANAMTSRLKVLASLDIAERRAPQDGGFVWRLPGGGTFAQNPLDVRMATLPVRHGERITLRLLETGGRRLTLEDLGMRQADLAVFEKVLRHPQGLVLLTGPTGSGKTTTLYAAIQRLLQFGAFNILTVEDPVEYEIPGVAQAEVDSADKVNFSKALKSLLRHDPDVVMIGEIRDMNSLDAAVKAALTGHLVLSTLHTNDAKSVETRLVDMGLDPHLVPATLHLAVAQRLVRRLCPACKVRGVDGWEPKGCRECGGRGYAGRIGLFELYSPKMGVETFLADDAREKVADGVTSFAEVRRVTGVDG